MQRIQNVLHHLEPSATAVNVVTSSDVAMSHLKYVKTETKGRVGIVTLNRPEALNALSDALMNDVGTALNAFDQDPAIGCIILTGEGRAFAAGADIKEMTNMTYFQMSTADKIEPWMVVARIKTPIVAAVNGVAFGGGCELCMMCDILVASDKAKFGQPEIKIGTIPGAGGTQRLTKAVGKSKAMEMCLTGNPITAQEALQYGFVSSVVTSEKLMETALKIANDIAGLSKPVVQLAKESVNASFETTLQQGVRFERRLFHSTFALSDQKEGMSAFVQKRAPKWTHN